MVLTKRVVGLMTAGLVLAGGTALWAGGWRQESPLHPELPRPTIRTSSTGTDHIKGLKGVDVVVEALDEDAATKIGLTRDRLQTATELALRRNGVKVLTQEERLATRGTPYLYVNVNVAGPAFNIDVELKENVRLERNPRIQVVGATVWKTSGAGTSRNPDFIVKGVEKGVEEFCLAYLKVNPKK